MLAAMPPSETSCFLHSASASLQRRNVLSKGSSGLQNAGVFLAYALSHRPPRSSLSPPNAYICLSRTNVLSRSIQKSLVRIRLNHTLSQRPLAADLVARAILPPSCCSGYSSPVAPGLIQSQQAIQRRRLRDQVGRKLERRPSVQRLVKMNILPEECGTGVVSPGLVATRRRVMRERLKDGLRAWVDGMAAVAQRKQVDDRGLDEGERVSVRALVKRLQARGAREEVNDSVDDGLTQEKKRAQAKWGREAEAERRSARSKDISGGYSGACSQPTRAHVLGLKRFWEGVIRAAAD